MTDLFAAVISITPTRRRRFLWAAWWTEPPTRVPFRKPDASQGGAKSRADALAEATLAAGRPLVEIEARWARAWSRILLGEPPWTAKEEQDPTPHARPAPRAEIDRTSIWHLLGVDPRAPVDEIKRSFRQLALASHPDHGGDPAAFRALRRAYDDALRRRERQDKKPKPKR